MYVCIYVRVYRPQQRIRHTYDNAGIKLRPFILLNYSYSNKIKGKFKFHLIYFDNTEFVCLGQAVNSLQNYVIYFRIRTEY